MERFRRLVKVLLMCVVFLLLQCRYMQAFAHRSLWRPDKTNSICSIRRKAVVPTSTPEGFFWPDKEMNRKFRRTIFTKVDWKRHRSSNRYFKELKNMPRSITLRSLGLQSLTVTLFSVFIVLYNFIIERKLLPFPMPLLSFAPLPFSLTSSALGLLLVFRTNTAYARWRDARISWATISAKSFDLMRQTVMWITDETTRAQIVRYTVSFSKCLKWHLGHQGNDKRLAEDLATVLTKSEVEKLLLSRNRVHWILMRISDVVAKSGLPYNAQGNLDKSLCDLTGAYTVCDRIFTTPIPLMYTRHTARFLLLWLLVVPMSLYHEFRKTQKWNLIFLVPVISFFNATFLFGIEELGVQIEEPFSILPLAAICNEIQNTGVDVLSGCGVYWFAGESDPTEEAKDKDKNSPSASVAQSAGAGAGTGPSTAITGPRSPNGDVSVPTAAATAAMAVAAAALTSQPTLSTEVSVNNQIQPPVIIGSNSAIGIGTTTILSSSSTDKASATASATASTSTINLPPPAAAAAVSILTTTSASSSSSSDINTASLIVGSSSSNNGNIDNERGNIAIIAGDVSAQHASDNVMSPLASTNAPLLKG